jgi:hypothetical protein
VKIEVTSDTKFMRSCGCKRQKGIELSEKEIEGNRLAIFRVGGRRMVYIENQTEK